MLSFLDMHALCDLNLNLIFLLYLLIINAEVRFDLILNFVTLFITLTLLSNHLYVCFTWTLIFALPFIL